jgi:CubicO group peptidase (beta-lactamase class C family)
MRLLLRLGRALPALVCFAALVGAQKPPPDFDGYVRRVMRTFTVPGLSVAIVKDGKTVLARGYGVRRLGEPAPVDERTRFGMRPTPSSSRRRPWPCWWRRESWSGTRR